MVLLSRQMVVVWLLPMLKHHMSWLILGVIVQDSVLNSLIQAPYHLVVNLLPLHQMAVAWLLLNLIHHLSLVILGVIAQDLVLNLLIRAHWPLVQVVVSLLVPMVVAWSLPIRQHHL